MKVLGILFFSLAMLSTGVYGFSGSDISINTVKFLYSTCGDAYSQRGNQNLREICESSKIKYAEAGILVWCNENLHQKDFADAKVPYFTGCAWKEKQRYKY